MEPEKPKAIEESKEKNEDKEFKEPIVFKRFKKSANTENKVEKPSSEVKQPKSAKPMVNLSFDDEY